MIDRKMFQKNVDQACQGCALWQFIQRGINLDIRRLNPHPAARRPGIRENDSPSLDLVDRYSNGRAMIDNRMLAKKDNFTGSCGCKCRHWG